MPSRSVTQPLAGREHRLAALVNELVLEKEEGHDSGRHAQSHPGVLTITSGSWVQRVLGRPCGPGGSPLSCPR
jgi:hypothetical protein